jgi:hypothetical protein
VLDTLENLLNELLDKKFTICPSKDGKIKLKEPNVSRHKIYGLPPAAVAVRLPTGQEGFLNQDKEPYTQICDYLIFIPQKGALTVILCELKKGVKSDSEKALAGCQIVSTIPLLQYFLSAIENHFGEKWSVSEIYALFGKGPDNARIAKRDMRLRGKLNKEVFLHQKNERGKNNKIAIQIILDRIKIPIVDLTESPRPAQG